MESSFTEFWSVVIMLSCLVFEKRFEKHSNVLKELWYRSVASSQLEDYFYDTYLRVDRLRTLLLEEESNLRQWQII